MARARSFIGEVDDFDLKTVLELACVSVLEEVSYTRKDGQYLRWDPRSGSTASTRLRKGEIPSLRSALDRKFQQIAADLPAVKRQIGRPAATID